MTIEMVKDWYKDGMLTLVEAMSFSNELGYSMAKIGKDKNTGMGGKWVWFKKK